MSDFPFHEVVQGAAQVIARGATVHQKFTCGGCGQRLTVEEPNKFFTEGTCDKCDHVTDIVKSGCNYLMIRSLAEQ